MTARVCKTSNLVPLYIINQPPELSELVDGHRKAEAVVSVDACGTENGQPAAWIVVNDKGLVTFFNQNGDRSACALDNGLKVGSQCSASILSSTSTSTSSGLPVPASGSTSSVSGPPTTSSAGKSPASASSDKPICGGLSTSGKIVNDKKYQEMMKHSQ